MILPHCVSILSSDGGELHWESVEERKKYFSILCAIVDVCIFNMCERGSCTHACVCIKMMFSLWAHRANYLSIYLIDTGQMHLLCLIRMLYGYQANSFLGYKNSLWKYEHVLSLTDQKATCSDWWIIGCKWWQEWACAELFKSGSLGPPVNLLEESLGKHRELNNIHNHVSLEIFRDTFKKES